MSKNEEELWLDIKDFADATFYVEELRPPTRGLRWKLAGPPSKWDLTFRIELPKEAHKRNETKE